MKCKQPHSLSATTNSNISISQKLLKTTEIQIKKRRKQKQNISKFIENGWNRRPHCFAFAIEMCSLHFNFIFIHIIYSFYKTERCMYVCLLNVHTSPYPSIVLFCSDIIWIPDSIQNCRHSIHRIDQTMTT